MQLYLWDKFLEVKLLDQRVCTFVILSEIAKLFSIDFVPIYIPISNEESQFLTPPLTRSCQTFWSLPIWQSKVVSPCSLICIHLIMQTIVHIFICFGTIWLAFPGKWLFISFASCFSIGLWVFVILIYTSSLYVWDSRS